MLVITTPAPDLNLLTLAELRAAAGIPAGDTSQDATLTMLGSAVSAMITAACRVPQGGVTPPTLRLETLTETFYPERQPRALVMARRPVVSITSVTETDTLLLTTDYDFDPAAGVLNRRCDGYPGYWYASPLVVEYVAGYAIVPQDLKYAAAKFVRSEQQRGTRDPLLRSKSIEGVSSSTWWVEPAKDEIVPSEVMSILEASGYINYGVM